MLLFRVAAFADHYRWSPPPMFSIGLTLVLIGVFIHQTFKQSVEGGAMLNIPLFCNFCNFCTHVFSPVHLHIHFFHLHSIIFTSAHLDPPLPPGTVLAYPVCSPLAIHPLYTHQPWRLLTYSLTHYG